MRDIELDMHTAEDNREVAWVDDEDFEELNKYKWHQTYNPRTLLSSVTRKGKHPETGRQTTFLMHRQIMNPPPGYFVDHRNKNPFDNTRENLRLIPHRKTIADMDKGSK